MLIEEATVAIKYFLFIVFVANCYLNATLVFAENRPRPNVITGGNPYKKDVPWPKSKPELLYGTLNKSTYYQRAYRKVDYKGYIRFYKSCAAHRYGLYTGGGY